MSFQRFNVLIFTALLSVVPEFVHAQDQSLRVEVSGDSHPNFDPIDIRVTNTTSKSIELAVPVNVLKNSKERVRNPLPIDVEKHAGDKWIATKPGGRGGTGRTIRPGQTITLTAGISGSGEYRVRVWYVVDQGDPTPPIRKPVFWSVVSDPFQVTPTPPTSN
jgi:hypothetical protein